MGYDYKDGNIVINNREAKIIKLIFDLANNDKSYTHIARHLNDTGYRTKHGVLFTVKKVRTIVKNPLYCGYIRHYDKTHKGIHDPIISEELFNKAQKTISQRIKLSPNRPAKYLLTGFLRCGNCGYSMGGYKNSKGYWNYRCLGYNNGICKKSVHIQKDKIEKFVIGRICKKLNELDLNKIKQKAVESTNETETIFDTEREIKKIKRKMDKLLDEYLEGYMTKDKYHGYINKLNRETEELKEKNGVEYDYSILENINTPEFFKVIELEDKRKIISLFLNKIIVYKMKKTRKLENRIECYWNEIV